MDEGSGQIDGLIRDLRRVRARARALLIVQRVAVLAGVVLAAVFGEAMLDLVVRLPVFLRGLVLVGGVGAVVWSVRRHVLPAVRFAPSLTDIALRIERVRPELRGRLASAVDFAGFGGKAEADEETRGLVGELGGDQRIGGAFSARVVREVGGDWGWAMAAGVLRGESARQRGGALGTGLVVLLVIGILLPTMFGIGAARVLVPWSGAEWPRRTNVADVTGAEVHALGTALAMRAALTKWSGDVERSDVVVRYRVIDDGEVVRSRREAMTWQERVVNAPATPDSSGLEGQLFERLIEPSGDAVEYRFESEDDQTEWARVVLVEPPSVVRAEAVITSPAYIGGEDSVRTVDLGPGTDERAIAPVSLAGSSVELRVELNKRARVRNGVLAALGEDGQAELDGDTWHARWLLGETTRLSIELEDEHGIGSVDPAVFRFEAREDRTASVTIIEPAMDETVLPGAVVEVVGEARDDVGVRWLTIERERFAPAGSNDGVPSGPGGALESVGGAIETARVEGEGLERALTAEATVDLGGLGVRAGDEVQLTAVALDIFAVEGVIREASRSEVRILRVISAEQFVEEMRGGLADVRQSAIRIETRQGAMRERLGERGVDEEGARGQSQIGERIERQREAVDRMAERAARNNLEDEALDDMLAAARESLEAAGRASARAGEAMDKSQQSEDSGEQQRERVAAEDAQEETQRELANLIEMLDRGEDSWVVRNAIEGVLREQRELMEETQRAGRQTAGRQSEELSAGERAEQERIVREQEELREQMENVQEELRERAADMQEADPGTAQGMQRAADRAEQKQVAQKMQQAAESAQQNRMASAGDQQQEAVEALEEMLEDLDEIERARDEALRRIVRSIIESLGRLIRDQSGALAALDVRVDDGKTLDGLDRGMIALNTNTLGVLDTARRGGAELAPVAGILDRAAGAQTSAVQGLRAVDRDSTAIREHESRSLELLVRAKERAEEVEAAAESREQEKKKRELKRAYREVLEQQVELRGKMERFAALERLSRRDRVLIRKGGEVQRGLLDRLEELMEKTGELREAKVFEYAHRRAVSAIERSADLLTEDVDPGASLPHQDRAIRSIAMILEALADPKQPDSPFDDGASDGGGSGSGSGGGGEKLIPPVKELRLLRALQGDLTEMTREADDLHDAPGLEEAGVMQLELFDIGTDLIQRVQQGADGGDDELEFHIEKTDDEKEGGQ